MKAEKKAARVAADGVLKIFVGTEYATIIEVNSETDFAAKDSNFINFTNEVHDYIANNKISNISELHESEIEVKRKAFAISPVPGGVGPMTIACLLRNTFVSCKKKLLV